jgi:DNA-binding transcriptional LysR family regulator
MPLAVALPSLSTDQVAAFVELARRGSLRRAAEALCITEQGVRNRLIALERRLGAQLYHKRRGRRSADPLTTQGRAFLAPAIRYLEVSRALAETFAAASAPDEIHVAASQYLILYVLIDAVRRFHAAHPQVRVRLSSHTEQEIEELLLRDGDISLGIAAPYETPAELEYRNLFPLEWSLITPPRHRLSRLAKVTLADVAELPLIVFERGSTGRQHVIDAFHAAGLSPRIEMETTNTEIIVRMVEAGLGVSIVPLLATGAVTKGRRVAVRSLGKQVRPIQSGILKRRGETLSPAAGLFMKFLLPRAASEA